MMILRRVIISMKYIDCYDDSDDDRNRDSDNNNKHLDQMKL